MKYDFGYIGAYRLSYKTRNGGNKLSDILYIDKGRDYEEVYECREEASYPLTEETLWVTDNAKLDLQFGQDTKKWCLRNKLPNHGGAFFYRTSHISITPVPLQAIGSWYLLLAKTAVWYSRLAAEGIIGDMTIEEFSHLMPLFDESKEAIMMYNRIMTDNNTPKHIKESALSRALYSEGPLYMADNLRYDIMEYCK